MRVVQPWLWPGGLLRTRVTLTRFLPAGMGIPRAGEASGDDGEVERDRDRERECEYDRDEELVMCVLLLLLLLVLLLLRIPFRIISCCLSDWISSVSRGLSNLSVLSIKEVIIIIVGRGGTLGTQGCALCSAGCMLSIFSDLPLPLRMAHTIDNSSSQLLTQGLVDCADDDDDNDDDDGTGDLFVWILLFIMPSLCNREAWRGVDAGGGCGARETEKSGLVQKSSQLL